MNARPRIRKRAHFPPNLHEPRTGYYTWRNPLDGKTHVIGRVPLAQAIQEANEANAQAENVKPRRSLIERVSLGRETMADLLKKMPSEGAAANTVKVRKSLDNAIRAALGEKVCHELTTKGCAIMIEEAKDRGKMRWAKMLRSRLFTVCARGVALGWMDSNPVSVTEKVVARVSRKRMTIEQFWAIYEKAPMSAEWLQRTMLLALLTGQDRSTIAELSRAAAKDGVLMVRRPKTKIEIAIPLALRLDVAGWTLSDVVALFRTGIVSKHLLHRGRQVGIAERGSPVSPDTISMAFLRARRLAKIPEDNAPTFHEIRSLAKRLYEEQGNVDTKALLGHKSDSIANLYLDPRGIAPIQVKIGIK